MEEVDVVDEVYVGESHRSIVTRARSHFEVYKPQGRPGGAEGRGVARGVGEEDEEMRKAGSWMREHTLQCHGGEFSHNKMDDYEFVFLRSHSKVLRRQLEEAIFLAWAQGRGCIKVGNLQFKVNRNILNSKIEHWRPRPVFIIGR